MTAFAYQMLSGSNDYFLRDLKGNMALLIAWLLISTPWNCERISLVILNRIKTTACANLLQQP